MAFQGWLIVNLLKSSLSSLQVSLRTNICSLKALEVRLPELLMNLAFHTSILMILISLGMTVTMMRSFLLFMRTTTINRYVIQSISDGAWTKFPWIEHERDFTSDHLRETWSPSMTVFAIYCYLNCKTCPFLPNFTRKLLKLQESGVNGNSQHRTED